MISGKRLRNLALIEALVTEREAMITDNLQRTHRGESMAWSGEEFRALADKLRALASRAEQFSAIKIQVVACPQHGLSIKDGKCQVCGWTGKPAPRAEGK